MCRRWMVVSVVAVIFATLAGPRTGPSGRRALRMSKSRAIQQLKAMPIAFEANVGQTAEAASFVARGQGYAMWATADGPVLRLVDPRGRDAGATVRLRVVGGASTGHPSPEALLPGRANYFIGNDPANWRTDVPRYAALRYGDTYPGVDLVLHGTQQSLEYDFDVAPHADASQIAVAFDGAEAIRIEPDGDLTLAVKDGELSFEPPVAYQDRNGARELVAARYELGEGSVIRFALGEYDESQPLIIDPVLSYSTYLGGNQNSYGAFSVDAAYGMAVDGAGNAYLAGFTNAIDFPLAGGSLDTTCAGCTNSGGDAWVAKIDPSKSGAASLVFTTYLGALSTGPGTGSSTAYAVAADSTGNVYVTGNTSGFNNPSTPANEAFPTTPTALQPNDSGDLAVVDAFLTKLDPNGSTLLYSTYIGGNNVDEGSAISVNDAGEAVVAGWSASSNFSGLLNGFKVTNVTNLFDGFVTRIDTTLSGAASLKYGTLVGGGSSDRIGALAVDGGGRVYVTGYTQSTGLQPFPVLNGFQAISLGGQDAFMTMIDPGLSGAASLVYSTLISSNGTENGALHEGGVAVDGNGFVYVAGSTYSGNNFPITPGAYKSLLQSSDVYVVKIDPSQSGIASLVASTFLGGISQEGGTAMAVDQFDNPVVAGWSMSPDLGVTSCARPKLNGVDGFVTVLDPSLTSLKFSTPIGGSGTDHVYGLGIGPAGQLYVAGYTESSNFPTTTDSATTAAAFEPAHQGGQDAFMAVISLPLNACTPPSAFGVDTTTVEDTTLQLTLDATDVEGNNAPADTLTWTVTTAPAHGTLNVTGGTMTHGAGAAYGTQVNYTPATNYHGPDSFQFRVNDGASDSNIATVTIGVTPVNDNPTAMDDAAQTDDNTLIIVAVLANDFDPEGDTVSLASADSCAQGTVTANLDGTITYAPKAGFGGVDVCSYTASDEQGASASAQLTVTVTKVNDPPSLVNPGDQQTAEGIAVSLQLNASDPDGDGLTFTATGLPGGLSMDANGLISGAPDAGTAGTHQVTVWVEDGQGGQANAAFTWLVTAPVASNEAPVCTAAQPSVSVIWPPDHRLVPIQILGVTDPDGGQAAVVITRILQDEPTNTFGDGSTWIDGIGIGGSTAQVRAERVGTPRAPGDGRVYEIFFTASDAHGAACSGSVLVSVPRDSAQGSAAVDSGVRYDSTTAGGQALIK